MNDDSWGCTLTLPPTGNAEPQHLYGGKQGGEEAPLLLEAFGTDSNDVLHGSKAATIDGRDGYDIAKFERGPDDYEISYDADFNTCTVYDTVSGESRTLKNFEAIEFGDQYRTFVTLGEESQSHPLTFDGIDLLMPLVPPLDIENIELMPIIQLGIENIELMPFLQLDVECIDMLMPIDLVGTVDTSGLV
jgi:hypothetical protein